MPSRACLLLVALLAALAVACGSHANRGGSTATQPPAPLRVAAQTPGAGCGAASQPATLRRGSQVSTINSAYRDLLAEYFRPLQPDPLLEAAWQGATAEASREAGAQAPAETLAPLTSNQADADWRVFSDAYAKLSDATEGKVDQVQLAFAAVAQMAASLNEGHTYFVPPEAFAQEGKEPQLSGIGVEVTGRTAPFTITDVVSGGPAARAGVKPGETITAVNGCPAQSLDTEQLSQLIRGKAGTTVQITLGEAGGGNQQVTITRADVTFPLIETQLLPNHLGLVRLHSFPGGSTKLQDGHTAAQDLAGDLVSFRSGGVTAWILDLRGDPGGEVTGLQAIAGVLLPPGPICSFVDRKGTRQTIRTDGSRVATPPLKAVLVDGGTASAAEILTSAIQEEGVAQVVGTKTAGIANGAELEPLPNGAGLSITHFQTYTVDGTALNGEGVSPNIVVDRTQADVTSGVDPQLERAEQVAGS
jgi:carboxyl-terminal processing protease